MEEKGFKMKGIMMWWMKEVKELKIKQKEGGEGGVEFIFI